ncbi:MAG: hypothetical protein AAF799_20915 [Myxococcota bacterium]
MSNAIRHITVALYLAGTTALGVTGCDTTEGVEEATEAEAEVAFRTNPDGDDPDLTEFCEDYDGSWVRFRTVFGGSFITADGTDGVTYRRVHELPPGEANRMWWKVDCNSCNESARFENTLTGNSLFARYDSFDGNKGVVVQAPGNQHTDSLRRQYRFDVRPVLRPDGQASGMWTLKSNKWNGAKNWAYPEFGGNIRVSDARPTDDWEKVTIEAYGATATE